MWLLTPTRAQTVAAQRACQAHWFSSRKENKTLQQTSSRSGNRKTKYFQVCVLCHVPCAYSFVGEFKTIAMSEVPSGTDF